MVKSNIQDITHRWVDIIAECFGAKSLQQHYATNQPFRLKVNCAVVVQKLIADKNYVAGVMHVHRNGSIIINVAPSHG